MDLPPKTRFRNEIFRVLVEAGPGITAILSAAALEKNILFGSYLSIMARADLLFERTAAKGHHGSTPVIKYTVIASLTPELKAIHDGFDDKDKFGTIWNVLCREYSDGGIIKELINREAKAIREQNTAAPNNNGADTTSNNNGNNPMAADRRAMSHNNAETDPSRPRQQQTDNSNGVDMMAPSPASPNVEWRRAAKGGRVNDGEATAPLSRVGQRAMFKNAETGQSLPRLQAEMAKPAPKPDATKKKLEDKKTDSTTVEIMGGVLAKLIAFIFIVVKLVVFLFIAVFIAVSVVEILWIVRARVTAYKTPSPGAGPNRAYLLKNQPTSVDATAFVADDMMLPGAAVELDATKKELEEVKRRVEDLEAERAQTNFKLDATKEELYHVKAEMDSKLGGIKKELEDIKKGGGVGVLVMALNAFIFTAVGIVVGILWIAKDDLVNQPAAVDTTAFVVEKHRSAIDALKDFFSWNGQT